MSPSRTAVLNALQQLLGDKYEMVEWIGGGGMADVFLARHRTHGALFAVKVLASHLAGNLKVVARFMAEARTAATLSGHPNIAAIYDIGEGGGLHYLIMPYVEAVMSCGSSFPNTFRRARSRLTWACRSCILTCIQ